jgi:hypothetical protein
VEITRFNNRTLFFKQEAVVQEVEWIESGSFKGIPQMESLTDGMKLTPC